MEPLDSQLHEIWLCQLTREYKDICFRYRVPLKLPILTISSGEKLLGSWTSNVRILAISHFLISRYPWTLTLQILKHEMAHQICSELYGCEDAGHGPLFRQACYSIGLDAPFHRAEADLEGEIETENSKIHGQEQHIIDKIKKLLALGASDNVHEAALALQRASEFLTRYRLNFNALAENEGFRHCTINTRQQILPLYRKTLCSLLGDCFGVRVICSSLYDPLALRSFKTIELLGRTEEIAIAEHCYYFLEDRLQALWHKNRKRFQGNARTTKNSYYLGLLTGFRETLERSASAGKQKKTTTKTNGLLAPVCLTDQGLDEFVTFRFPRLQKRQIRETLLHQKAYVEAVHTGREIILHRPMENQARQTVSFLPLGENF